MPISVSAINFSQKKALENANIFYLDCYNKISKTCIYFKPSFIYSCMEVSKKLVSARDFYFIDILPQVPHNGERC